MMTAFWCLQVNGGHSPGGHPSRLVYKTVLATFTAHGSSMVWLLSWALLAADGSCVLFPSFPMNQIVADKVH